MTGSSVGNLDPDGHAAINADRPRARRARAGCIRPESGSGHGHLGARQPGRISPRRAQGRRGLLARLGQRIDSFIVQDETRTHRARSAPRSRGGSGFGPCVVHASPRLQRAAHAGPLSHRRRWRRVRRVVRIGRDVYAGAADTLLYYMREQRSGFNPVFRDSVHTHDGIIVDSSARRQVHPGERRLGRRVGLPAVRHDVGERDVRDAAWRIAIIRAPSPMQFDARTGSPGANGMPDVLDEARHGLEWLVRMFPSDTRDVQPARRRSRSHVLRPADDRLGGLRLGKGKGAARVSVHRASRRDCSSTRTARRAARRPPASTRRRSRSARACSRQRDPAFARELREQALRRRTRRARASRASARRRPGASPYFYEEDNWVDDMELGAAELYALTRDARYSARRAASTRRRSP